MLKYISKYETKEKEKLESYHHMLTKISQVAATQDPVVIAIQNLFMKTIVEHDLGS